MSLFKIPTLVSTNCSGNTQGICSLVKGMKMEDAVSRLEGIKCGPKGTICPGLSGYSSLTVLPDGKVGIYLEEDDGNGAYDLWFRSFPIEHFTGEGN